MLTNIDSTSLPRSRDIVTIFAREICIRSILQDTLRSSIMHQIFSKQESAHTHRHPPYFSSLHLVHHHNSVLKTSYSLFATPLSFLQSCRARAASIFECIWFFQKRISETICSCICLYCDHKVARENLLEGEIRPLSSIPPRIEFESKAPHLEAGEPVSSQPTNLN